LLRHVDKNRLVHGDLVVVVVIVCKVFFFIGLTETFVAFIFECLI
jgi:hypothetical protein